jgi:hypothetical protein
MKENPYWEIFDWHPMNRALKKSRHGRRYCTSCGKMLQDDWNYCTGCGSENEPLQEKQELSRDEATINCSECKKTLQPDEVVKCYDCGRIYCVNCAGPDWLGVCPDCEEVFEAEEDYWNWT